MDPRSLRLPRLPVAGWDAFFGNRRASVPAVSDLPSLQLTTSGRAAIYLALELLGVGRGDRVLLPTYHCPTMVSPVVALGAEPVFFPIDADGAPLIDWIERQDLTQVRAMVAVHYFGFPRNLAPARAFCDRHEIALIEDCAHAFFGSAVDRQIGALGDFAIASLPKFFPVNEGGYLASARRTMQGSRMRRRDRVAALRQFIDTIEIAVEHERFQPLTPLLHLIVAAKNMVRGRRPAEGRSVDSGGADAAAGDASMPSFDVDLVHQEPAAIVRWIERHARRTRIIEARQRNYRGLAERFQLIKGARVLEPVLPPDVVPYVFPLWVDEPALCYQAIRRAGVPVFCWDVLWPGVPEIPGDTGLQWSRHVLQLGCHQDLDDQAIQNIADSVRTLIEGRA